MATENHLTSISLLAGADLSTKQFCFVKMDTTADQVVLSVAGNAAIGVLQDKPTSGHAGAVAIDGVTKVVLGGTVAAGALVASDASAHAVTAATGAHILGVCKRGGVVGEIGELILQAHGIAP